MELVIPVMTLQDARAAVEGGAKMISVKNLHEGSMGANLPYTIRTIRKKISRRIRLGATVGNFPGYMTCTAAQAALGAAFSGAKDHVTVGLYKVPSYREAAKMVKAVSETIKRFDKRIGVGICSFADYKEIGSISPKETLDILVDSQADIAVMDVAGKNGKTIFDYMSIEELRSFVEGAHSHGLWTLFLGSLEKTMLKQCLRPGRT
ncbi:MAG: (5-formylfuran-3-yl)methyl phosphate synthase [bacterium]